MCNRPELNDGGIKKQTRIRSFLETLRKKWVVTIIVEIAWLIWAFSDRKAHFGRFTESTPYTGQYYLMSITMIFGSLVAGATPAGGGAVAFPVMSLALSVPTTMARDFSLGIQSFGMTAASFIIYFLEVPLDIEALIYGTIGGTTGLLIGLEGVAPFLLPAYTKMFFVSLWLSFAVALAILNRRIDRKVYDSAKEADEACCREASAQDASKVTELQSGSQDENKDGPTSQEIALQKAKRKRIIILLSIGFFGGICSAIAGSGLDMATFSVLTLYYRESEKVATPTSVVLMAVNAFIGILVRTIPIGGQYAAGERETLWKFISVAIPVVVIGAPLGAYVPIILSRHQIAYTLYILSIAQFVLACIVVKPWAAPSPHAVGLSVACAVTLLGGSALFYKLANMGEARDAENESKNESKVTEGESDIERDIEFAGEIGGDDVIVSGMAP